MNLGRVLTGALLLTLATPASWPVALATFLLRGGIVLVVAPIVVLPSPEGLGNLLGPALSSIALGSVSIELVALAGAVGVGVGVLAWLVAGGLIAAALEAAGARIVAGAAGAPFARPPGDGRVPAQILFARLVAHLPLAVTLALGSVRLVVVAYGELTSPDDVGTPIVLRVLAASPEVVVAVVLAWLFGEIVGGMAARHIMLAHADVGRALRHAVATCLRSPTSTAARSWVPTAVLVIVLAFAQLAANSAWGAVGSVLGERTDPLRILVAVATFVALWTVGLLLVSVVCAWRAAVWTVAELVREGTFGGSAGRRPGDWRGEGSSATL